MRYLMLLISGMLVGCGISYDCHCHCLSNTGHTFDVIHDGICAQDSIDAGNAVPDGICGDGAILVGKSCVPNGDGICFDPSRLAPMLPIPDSTVPAK